MAEKGVLRYRVHEPTQFSREHTEGNYLIIETVDMDEFPNAAQTYIDEYRAPMAGALTKLCEEKKESRGPSF